MLDMSGCSLISADSHVIEPPDLFSARLPAKLRDRAPRLETASGVCRWSVDGDSAPLPDSVVNGSGWRRAPHGPRTFDDVLPALYDAPQRLVAQDADGVAAEVLYPFPGLWDLIRASTDHEVILGCVRAYNDWIAEFSADSPNRLIGLGRIPMTGFDDACEELERCVERSRPTRRGHRRLACARAGARPRGRQVLGDRERGGCPGQHPLHVGRFNAQYACGGHRPGPATSHGGRSAPPGGGRNLRPISRSAVRAGPWSTRDGRPTGWSSPTLIT